MKTESTQSKTDRLADFRPFRPWRYDMKKVAARDVLAPPYDVISSAKQDELYGHSPYNSIRLILNKIEDSDTETNSRYTRARDFFNNWREEGILTREDKPCFYLYRQKYSDPATGEKHSRSALLGALKLEAFENHVVIPHEKTLAKPRADRRKLLETTQTNFSPVFGLFEDPSGEVAAMLPALAAGTPVFQVTDEDEVTHGLWVIEDEAAARKIQDSLKSQRVYIADGHHRYTTALHYGQEKHKEESAEIQPSDFIYMALVSFNDPGLVLMPTHRLVKDLPDFELEKAMNRFSEFFELKETAPENISAELKKFGADETVLGICTQSRGFVLRIKDREKARAAMLPDKPDVWYSLDVNVVAYLILKNLWNIHEDQWEDHLMFTHSDGEAFAALEEGKAQAAFIMKAPSVTVLRDMGNVRELMPQKSTYFYPKLASGLLFFHHDQDAVSDS